MAKPTGSIGPIHVTSESLSWDKVEFPKDKKEIEKLIMEIFDRNLSNEDRNHLNINLIRQNDEENDIDCTVLRRSGNRQMDLVEIAPLNEIGRKYANASGKYIVGEFVDTILQQISNKSKKYPVNTWLLCYTTHWAFLPSETVVKVLQSSLANQKSKTVFERIFFMLLKDDTTGSIQHLYPADPSILRLNSNDINKMREGDVINLHPGRWEYEQTQT